MKKIIALILLSCLVLFSISNAFAADVYAYEYYNGACVNNFNTDSTATGKANGYDDAYMNATKKTSRVYYNGHKAQNSAMNAGSQQYYWDYAPINSTGLGKTCYLNVKNSNTGVSTRYTGYWGMTTATNYQSYSAAPKP